MCVVVSCNELQTDNIPIKNFKPIGEFELPEYELQKLSFPPILQILDYIQREKITEIIISTPGPIGLTGLLAAKMLNLQTSGIYHTDFPQYIRILTEDGFLESVLAPCADLTRNDHRNWLEHVIHRLLTHFLVPTTCGTHCCHMTPIPSLNNSTSNNCRSRERIC